MTATLKLKPLGLVLIPCYIAAIVVANIVTANEPPLMFDWLGQHWIVTWGTFFIAATFFLRDGVQIAFGRRGAYAAIAAALIANLAMSSHYANLAWIVAASCIAFALSETLDTETFTRLRGSLGKRIAVSGVLGGTLDSIVFAVIGLSPLTTGIVPWQFLWTTIVAQIVVKCTMNLLVAVPVAAINRPAVQPS
jgi:uncharacterized PurR-regulated membrane protein YhhQ (DUF165 family)